MAGSLVVIAVENGAALILPESAFTERQRTALAHIVRHRGVDALVAAPAPFRALVTDQVAPPHTPSPSDEIRRQAMVEAARGQGFSGDICDRCGGGQMKRSGTCLTCQSCGSTTGCS